MTPLEQKIRLLIEQEGPLSVPTYMNLCLTHSDHGYYTTGHPVGGKASSGKPGGDFITAPEVSQMFGELIGVWCMEMWRSVGCPTAFNLVEIGPGRGTLMKDLLRAGSALAPFFQAANVHLVEISPTLMEEQARTLESVGKKIEWHTQISTLPDAPTIFVGNELLDALPFYQWIKTPDGWMERAVGIIDNKLTFLTKPTGADNADLPDGHSEQKEGSILETSPAREALVEQIARYIASNSGAALMIDYGHTSTAYGDTFQAMKDHAYVDVFDKPGYADLTSHVDFQPLLKIATAAGCTAPQPTAQSNFLLALGLLERAGALGAGRDESIQLGLHQAVERLAGPEQMGSLFKVFAFAASPQPVNHWPGFD